MRIAAAISVLFALKALALPTSDDLADGPAVDGENDEFSFTFTGPVVVGGSNVTLYGTAKAIYDQVMGLNPNYEADFPIRKSNTENADASLGYSPTSLQRRDDTVQSKTGLDGPEYGPQHGVWDCNKGGKFVREAAPSCAEGFDYLEKLGNAACGAGPGQKVRVSCSNKCGMFYHNRRDSPHQRPCIDIRNDLMRVFNKCAKRVFLNTSWDIKGRLTKPGEKEFVEIHRDKC